MSESADDACRQLSHLNNYPYTPSIASAASSSWSSVFSVDGKSSQSSAPSSVKSGSPTWDSDSGNYQGVAQTEYSNPAASHGNFLRTSEAIRIQQHNAIHVQQILPCEVAVAPELRVNPRRTQQSSQAGCQDGKSTTRAPPSLVRQCDRKDNFVESLVGKPTLPNSPPV